MKISKTVTHHVRMGPYESLTIGTTVELDLPDDSDRFEAMDDIDASINAVLDSDIKKARELAVEDSYIHDWGN